MIVGMAFDRAHELIDFGGGGRLERFGELTVDRPHPAALGSRQDVEAWRHADLHFDRERGWMGPATDDGPWTIGSRGLAIELRPTEAGQLGLFPEHFAMLPWLETNVSEPGRADTASAILNLFAYTGLVTLALAAAGAAVTHVDSSRPAVAWARRNAEASGLADRPIRWIVEDALEFTQREARRGRRYAGVVLDPPTYGHGPNARPWHLDDDLATLLAAAAQVLNPGGFVLLTAHTPGFDGERLAALLGHAVPRTSGAIEHGKLGLSTADGRRLELGAFARTRGSAS